MIRIPLFAASDFEVAGVTGIFDPTGASLPLDAGVKNEEVCPLSDLRADRFERLSRVEIRHSFRRPEAAIRATAGEPSGYGPFPTHGQA